MRKFLLSTVLVCALFIPLLIPLSLIADCSYDQNSNISTIFIPGNGEVKYTYDPINRLTSADYSSGKFFHYSFEYNEDSNLLESITFPDGQKETYHYNTQGLPTQIKLSNGTTITREYDARHRLTKAKAQGKEIQYDYDSRDHITKITTQEKSNHFSYDLSGNLASHTDPLNRTTKHTYDSHEKLIQTIDPLRQSTTYEYNPSGLCKMHLPNGSTREIFYDEHARPTAIR